MKKKITFFIEVLGWGGIETFIANVLSNIDLCKYDIDIVCINKISNHFDEMMKNLGVNIVVLEKNRITNPIKRYFIGVKLLGEYIENHHCRIIHFHISNAVDYLHIQMAKSKGVKYRISHCHNSDVNRRYKKIGHEVLKVLLKNAPTHRVACSKKAYRWLYSNIMTEKNNPVIFKNGINVEKFKFDEEKRNKLRAELGLENKYVMINIARFNLQKNHTFLIDLFDEYAKNDKDAVLLLIGAGELMEEIKQKASKLKSSSQIIFCGEIDDVAGYLMASDVFVLPSLYEGLPVVGIEAQTTGISCIFSDTITRELKINPNTEYCSIENTEVWVDSLKKIKENCIRIKNTKRITKCGYDISETAREIEKMYDSLK